MPNYKTYYWNNIDVKFEDYFVGSTKHQINFSQMHLTFLIKVIARLLKNCEKAGKNDI